MADPETVVLERSGVALPRINDCNWGIAISGYRLWFGTDQSGYYATIGCLYKSFDGDRVAALAWLDARVLELRAALLPPGAFVVADGPETVEWIERAICNNLDAETYMEQARAVLSALREARK